MHSLDQTVQSHIVHRAHIAFRVKRSDIDCLQKNNVLITQAAPFARRETYWDNRGFPLLEQGFSLKVVSGTERPWILEEKWGIHAEATDRTSLMPLVKSGYRLSPSPFAELLVEIGVYSIKTLGGFRIELQRTSWEFSGELVFCHRLDVITRSECQDPKGACEEIVAAMGRFGISQRDLPIGQSHVENILNRTC